MMEGCIKQNNGIDIYIEYFENQDEVTQCEVPQTKTVGQSLVITVTPSWCLPSLVVRTVPGPGADRRTRETGGGLVIQNGWATVSFSRYFSKIINIIHYFTESPLPTAILSSRHSKRTLPNLPMSSILVIFLFGDLDIMT